MLTAAGAYTGQSSHGATESIYGTDPDGNEFELMWMLPREHWGQYENAAPVEPLELADELERWAGVRTAGHITVDTDGADGATATGGRSRERDVRRPHRRLKRP